MFVEGHIRIENKIVLILITVLGDKGLFREKQQST